MGEWKTIDSAPRGGTGNKDRCDTCEKVVTGKNNILDCTTTPPTITCLKCLADRLRPPPPKDGPCLER